MLRTDEAIKKWFPLAAISAGVTFVVTFILNLPVERVIAATALVGVMVFSGFFFRSFGKEKENYK
ncbi:MAG: hypothetical protein ACE5SW_01465 [Nitrososphaeraceae archaeon]